MKILLVNGSPHEHGCTYTALCAVKAAIEEDGGNADIFQLGTQNINGCLGCGACGKKGTCVFGGRVTEFTDICDGYDGYIFGSPVHYAAASGALTSFMDRVFYSHGAAFKLKPAAAVVSARRAGTTAALEQINKYFTICQMPVISSCYWNMVHGTTPDEVLMDKEGIRIMRTLGHNMVWFLKCKEAAKAAGITEPAPEPAARTNFIS